MSDAVLFDVRDGGIAIITIDRPDTRNCLSGEVRDGLRAAWNRFERDPALRVAIPTRRLAPRMRPPLCRYSSVSTTKSTRRRGTSVRT